MKITMLTTAADPQGNYQAGLSYEVGVDIPKEKAQAFLQGGYARLTEKARPAAASAAPIETAVAEPVAEKAVPAAPVKKTKAGKK